jgi:hypothetical protein
MLQLATVFLFYFHLLILCIEHSSYFNRFCAKSLFHVYVKNPKGYFLNFLALRKTYYISLSFQGISLKFSLNLERGY